MDSARKAAVARNLRRLIPKPWSRFARGLVDKPKNFYAYLREENPNTMPGPLLAEIARRLHVSMDYLLADSPAELPTGAIPALPRIPPRNLADEDRSSQDEEDLVAAWRRLEPSRRDYALMFLQALADGQSLECALAAAHLHAARGMVARATGASGATPPELRTAAGRSGGTPPQGPIRKRTAS